jgi:hypothetical protein
MNRRDTSTWPSTEFSRSEGKIRSNCGALRVPNPISLLEVSRELERSKETLPRSPDGVSRSFWVTQTNTLTRARMVCGFAARFRNRNQILFRPMGVFHSLIYLFVCLQFV